MMRMGRTISLAGSPKKNAININPSRPSNRPKGSRRLADIFSKLSPPKFILANSQVTTPAGVATIMALLNTNKVLSKILLIITLPT